MSVMRHGLTMVFNSVGFRVSGAHEELRRTYLATPEAAGQARDEFAALAARHGATDQQIDEVRLLVSEAVTNAVRHAYPDGPGTVMAAATVTEGDVTILVSDDGVGPRSESADPGGGWGWPLIAAVCDSFVIRRRSTSGTEIEMRLRIGPDHGPSGHASRGSNSSASMPPMPRFSTTM
jgi:anti-sigma regulatory factor (Ser/Thr protein kinase)